MSRFYSSGGAAAAVHLGVRASAPVFGARFNNGLLSQKGVSLCIFDFTFGKMAVQPTGIEGGWSGRWSSHFKDGVISASLVAQGTGALNGLQLMMDIEVLGTVPEDHPCDDTPFYVARSTGRILETHGD